MAKETAVSKISPRIEWLKERLDEIIKAANDLPYNEIEDRIVKLNMGKGIVEKVAATKEQIETSRRNAIKDAAQLTEMIEKMEMSEAAKIESRGNVKISGRATKFFSEK